MVTTTENKLIIEIDHPCPEELLKDIRGSIINLIQLQAGNCLTKEDTEHNSTALDLFKEMIIKDEN